MYVQGKFSHFVKMDLDPRVFSQKLIITDCLQCTQKKSEWSLILEWIFGDVQKVKFLLHLSQAGIPRNQP